MRIAWDLKRKVTKIQTHKLIAPKLKAALQEILIIYGLEQIQKLEIDLFGGCYNYRKMRGGTSWSRHAWGIAIDLSPQKNGLRTKWSSSQFSKPEYKQMIDSFYKHGFINLGVEKGYDAMHFEINQ